MIRQVAYLFAGNGAAAVIPFVRNILIARLISVEDFGIAATFALTFSLIEMVTNVSHGRLLVQAQEGDSEEFQGNLQTLQVLRGLLNAALLFAIAHPFAAFMQVPQAAWAYQVIALCPLLRGLSHFDIVREQRGMKFSGIAIATAVPAFVSLVSALGLSLVFDDYRIMLWAIILQQASYTLVSHILATRRYRLDWDLAILKQAFSFGLPLLGSNILMFLIFQGDRLLIGNQMGPEVLGWYSVAFLLVATPSLNLANTYQTLTLPELAKRQTDNPAFLDQAQITIEGMLFLAAGMVLGVAFFGPAVLIPVFGMKYEPALSILVIFSCAQALRLLRAGIVITWIARANTKLVLYTSLIRVVALPCGYAALVSGYGVNALLFCNILGEILAIGFALVYSNRKHLLRLRSALVPLAAFLAVLTLAIADALLFPPTADLLNNLHVFLCLPVLAFLFLTWSLHAGRRYLGETVWERYRGRLSLKRKTNGS